MTPWTVLSLYFGIFKFPIRFNINRIELLLPSKHGNNSSKSTIFTTR
nr:MAG TPA: hypothetical protein [Caudoviricetes sp.]